jgi:hypothetical protein
VPAFRSRTLQWRRSIEQLAARGGAIELSLAPTEGTEGTAPADLVWRVRVMAVGEGWLEVESPLVLGRAVPVPYGSPLRGAIAAGPNRWVFETVRLAHAGGGDAIGRAIESVRLRMPTEVERSRRAHLRVATAALGLPQVELWPLLEENSVRPIERALELAVEPPDGAGVLGLSGRFWEQEPLRPSLGDGFRASLVNLGGGGAGLRIDAADAGCLGRHRRFWMVLDLRPEAALPLCASLRIAHLHLDASGATYAGVAFDTAANPAHARWLADRILEIVSRRHRRLAA